ncbi:MAG: hypothetical protein GXO80_11995 [Chlorobi bacterium]|nr:hypothetical protein [Chlorobiota bacterium]
MAENKTKNPIAEADFYKKEANRYKKIFQLQRMKAEEVPVKNAVNPFLCLHCMWLESCNGIQWGGCEEFEQRLSVRQ